MAGFNSGIPEFSFWTQDLNFCIQDFNPETPKQDKTHLDFSNWKRHAVWKKICARAFPNQH
jgi:hypothetical protein